MTADGETVGQKNWVTQGRRDTEKETSNQPRSQVLREKDPGCGLSRDHPEFGWQKNLLGGRGGRVFCLLL